MHLVLQFYIRKVGQGFLWNYVGSLFELSEVLTPPRIRCHQRFRNDICRKSSGSFLSRMICPPLLPSLKMESGMSLRKPRKSRVTERDRIRSVQVLWIQITRLLRSPDLRQAESVSLDLPGQCSYTLYKGASDDNPTCRYTSGSRADHDWRNP